MSGMRVYIFLILIAVVMSFAAGSLSLSLWKTPREVRKLASEMFEKKQEFFKENQPLAQIDLNKLYKGSASREFIDPSSRLPHYHLHPYEEMSQHLIYEENCIKNPGHKSPGLHKAWLWAQYRCGEIKILPPGFFEKPPFFHPSGNSYAYLNRDNVQWLSRHLNLLHVMELAELELLGDLALKQRLQVLELDDLAALSRGEEVILSPQEVLLRLPDDVSSAYKYAVFPMEKWQGFWARNSVKIVKYKEGMSCYSQQGYLCWAYNVDRLYVNTKNPVLILFCSSLVLILVVLSMVFRKVMSDKKEEEKKRFALQVLTHELRTPIASLALSVEGLRERFGDIEESAQRPLLRVFDDVERLKRLAAYTGQYLSTDLKQQLVEVKPRKIESVSEFVERVLEPYRQGVHLEIVGQDDGFSLDPFWTSLCIKNLVENALQHGQPPVNVQLHLEPGVFTLTVKDAGQKTFDPQYKGTDSSGLGVGFKLVTKVVQELNGRLSFATQPTRFTIQFQERA